MQNPAFTLRQLQYVVATADTLGFRKAAALCHVSQPALSAQIALVEAGLSVQVFERDPRGVRLTRAGEDVVARARAVLAAAAELVAVSHRHRDPLSGTVRVGVIPTIAPYLVPEVAPRLRKELPNLTLLWHEGQTAVLLAKLARAELDAVLVALEADGVGSLPHVVLGKDPFVLAAAPGHPLVASRDPIAPAELEGESVLVLEDGHCFRDQAESYCQRSGALASEMRATSMPTLVQMAASGLGVTLLPMLAVRVENRAHSLRLRKFSSRGPSRTLVLAWRASSALEPTVRAIAGAIRID